MNRHQSLKPQTEKRRQPAWGAGAPVPICQHTTEQVSPGRAGLKATCAHSGDRHLKEEPPGPCQPRQSYLQMLSHSQSSSA